MVNNKLILFLGLILLLIIVNVDAAPFTFRGFVQNSSFVNVTGANVTAYRLVQTQGPSTLTNLVSNTTNTKSEFSLTINSTSDSDMFTIKVFTNDSLGNVMQMSPSMPPLPQMAIQSGLDGGTFYLTQAATLFITALNSSANNASDINERELFNYIVKDLNLGFPIDEDFSQSGVSSKEVKVPADRNYSIMIFPRNSAPLSYTTTDYVLNTTSTGAIYRNITFNTTLDFVQIYGNVFAVNGSISSHTSFEIESYQMESGGISSNDFVIPQIENFLIQGIQGTTIGPQHQRTNSANGFFNISLPALANMIEPGYNVDRFTAIVSAYSTNGTLGAAGTGYFVAFQNVSTTYNQADINMNLTVLPAHGSWQVPPSTLSNMGSSLNFSKTSFLFQEVNDAGLVGAVTEVHAELQTTLSAGNGNGAFTVKWMADTLSSNGLFNMTFPNNATITAKVFSHRYAPLERKINLSAISSNTVAINLTTFDMDKMDELGEKNDSKDFNDNDVIVRFMKYTPACNIQEPDLNNCKIGNEDFNGGFNPLKAMMASKSNLQINITSTGTMLYFIGVDLFASGPPDAMMSDDPVSESENTTNRDQTWRFGSVAPDIYDRVYIGMSYNDTKTDEKQEIRMLLKFLYDAEGNLAWNQTTDPNITSLPSEWSDYNKTWFNTSLGGMICNNQTASPCYINTTTNMIWLNIPHFSDDVFVQSSGVDTTAPRSNATIYPNAINDSDADGNIEITWIDDAVESGETYRLYRHTSIINETTLTVNMLITVNASGIPEGTQRYEDNTSTNGTTYYYALVTVDSFGNYNGSVPSASWNATANDTIFPMSLENMTISASANVATLTWPNVTKDVQGNADYHGLQYKVYVGTSINLTSGWVNDTNSGFSLQDTITSNTTTYTYTASVTTTTLFHFVITTIDDGGNENKSILPVNRNYRNISLTYTKPATAAAGTPSGGGGSAAGATAAAAIAAASTIASQSSPQVWSSIAAGETKTYEVKKAEIPVSSITFDVKSEVNQAEVSVASLKSAPSTNPMQKTKSVYGYLQINTKNIGDALKEAKIRFNVDKKWINENNIDKSNIKLNRYSNEQWNELFTKELSSTDSQISYESTSPGFSYFAISAENKTAVEEAKKEEVKIEEKKAEEKKEIVAEKPKNYTWLILIIVIVVAIVIYLMHFKKEKKKKRKFNT